MTPTAGTMDDDVVVQPVAAALGAVVTGLDLRTVGPSAVDWISTKLRDHMVLFFPEQHLSIDQHAELAQRFGPLEAHPDLGTPMAGHPLVFELTATAGAVADEWHTDLTFLPSPSVLSVLNMVRCPDVGGDTIWTNLCLAYESLSRPLQELCDGLSALHDGRLRGGDDRMAVHPVVRLHPETGAKALYVSEDSTHRIVELSHRESEALLGFLTGWVTQPRFTVRYRWSTGTVAICDNRCTQHFVVDDFAGARVVHRATVSGDAPRGPARGWEPWEPRSQGAVTRHDRRLLSFLRPDDDHQR